MYIFVKGLSSITKKALPHNCLTILLSVVEILLGYSPPLAIRTFHIATSNCNLTTLIDRWHFYEPNKISLTIFGQPRNLLRFIEVGFITKIIKHFYPLEKKRNRILHFGSHRVARPAMTRHACQCSAAHARTHAAQPPSLLTRASRPRHGPRGGAAHGQRPATGETRVRRQICMDTPS